MTLCQQIFSPVSFLTTHEAKVGCALVKKQHQQQRQKKKDHVYKVNPLHYPVRKSTTPFISLFLFLSLFTLPFISYLTIYYLRCKRANGRHLRNQFPAILLIHLPCIVTCLTPPMYQWLQQQKHLLVEIHPFQGNFR